MLNKHGFLWYEYATVVACGCKTHNLHVEVCPSQANIEPQNTHLRYAMLSVSNAVAPISPHAPSHPSPHSHLSHAQTSPHPLPHRPLKVASPLPPHLGRLDIRGALVVGLRQHAHHADQDLLHALDRTPPLRGLFVVVRVVAGGVQDGDADEAGGVDCSACKECGYVSWLVCCWERLCVMNLQTRSECVHGPISPSHAFPSKPKPLPPSLLITHQRQNTKKDARKPTVRMPHLAQKPHRRWIERVILGELQFGGEDAAFKGGAVRALDEGFPEEDVVFGDGAGGDAVGRGGGEEFVFVEEAAGGDGGCHGGLVGWLVGWWVGGLTGAPEVKLAHAQNVIVYFSVPRIILFCACAKRRLYLLFESQIPVFIPSLFTTV